MGAMVLAKMSGFFGGIWQKLADILGRPGGRVGKSGSRFQKSARKACSKAGTGRLGVSSLMEQVARQIQSGLRFWRFSWKIGRFFGVILSFTWLPPGEIQNHPKIGRFSRKSSIFGGFGLKLSRLGCRLRRVPARNSENPVMHELFRVVARFARNSKKFMPDWIFGSPRAGHFPFGKNEAVRGF